MICNCYCEIQIVKKKDFSWWYPGSCLKSLIHSDSVKYCCIRHNFLKRDYTLYLLACKGCAPQLAGSAKISVMWRLVQFVIVIWHEVNRKNAWMSGQGESKIRSNALLVLEKGGEPLPWLQNCPRHSQGLRAEKILSYCWIQANSKGNFYFLVSPQVTPEKEGGVQNWQLALAASYRALTAASTCDSQEGHLWYLNQRDTTQAPTLWVFEPYPASCCVLPWKNQLFPEHWHQWQSEQVDLRNQRTFVAPGGAKHLPAWLPLSARGYWTAPATAGKNKTFRWSRRNYSSVQKKRQPWMIKNCVRDINNHMTEHSMQ